MDNNLAIDQLLVSSVSTEQRVGGRDSTPDIGFSLYEDCIYLCWPFGKWPGYVVTGHYMQYSS